MPLSNVPVPEGLDDPPHLLFWSFDVVSIFSIFTIIGALFDHPLVGAVAGVVAGALLSATSNTSLRLCVGLIGLLGLRHFGASPPRTNAFLLARRPLFSHVKRAF